MASIWLKLSHCTVTAAVEQMLVTMNKLTHCLFMYVLFALATYMVHAGPHEGIAHSVNSEGPLVLADEVSESTLLVDEDGWQVVPADLADTWAQQAAGMQALQGILAEWGLTVQDVAADGACQFTALCVSGSLSISPQELRMLICAYLAQHRDQYSQWVVGDFDEYLAQLAQPTTWGDHVTLLVAAIVLQRPITVHSTAGGDPAVIPTLPAFNEELPINLVHEHERHYLAVGQGEEEDAQQDPDCCKCGALMLQGHCIMPDSPHAHSASEPKPAKRIIGKTRQAAGESCPDPKPRNKPSPKPKANSQGPRGSSCPDPWSPHYSYGPTGEALKTKPGKCFRPLHKTQLRYPAILAMTDQECKDKLKGLGLVPKTSERICFSCGGRMQWPACT